MKYLLISILAIGLSAFTLGSGPKMKIYVVDESNAVVAGAKVQVFGSFEDYEKEENELMSAETNAKGFVQFKNLKEQKYYLLISKGSLNNHQTVNETEVLHVKGKNRFEIMID